MTERKSRKKNSWEINFRSRLNMNVCQYVVVVVMISVLMHSTNVSAYVIFDEYVSMDFLYTYMESNGLYRFVTFHRNLLFQLVLTNLHVVTRGSITRKMMKQTWRQTHHIIVNAAHELYNQNTCSTNEYHST